MNYAWLAVAIVGGFALGSLAVVAWMIWCERADDEPDTDFLTDYTMEDEL